MGKRVMGKHWFSRLIIACWSGSLPFVGMLTPDSLIGRFLFTASALLWVDCIVILVTALLAVADVIVADMMPMRFQSRLTHHRHIGFMVMATGLLYLGGVLAIKTGAYTALPSFWLPAIFAGVVTWLDLYARPRPNLQTKATA